VRLIVADFTDVAHDFNISIQEVLTRSLQISMSGLVSSLDPSLGNLQPLFTANDLVILWIASAVMSCVLAHPFEQVSRLAFCCC
jgi:hypothetical protein